MRIQRIHRASFCVEVCKLQRSVSEASDRQCEDTAGKVDALVAHETLATGRV